jgi:vitamin B12/bleomycin/antimicrobial peptide transport system ATP-binding/permease protein
MDAPVPPAELDRNRLKSLTQRFWHTAHGFWTGEQRRIAWMLTASLILLVIVQLVISYQLNVWNRTLFDALEKKDGAVVLRQAGIFVPLAAAGIVIAVLIVYVRMRTQRRWRAWLTEAVGDRWLNKGRYYQLNFIGGDHANPEYRLAEDMRVATEAPVDLATGVLTAVLTAGTFIGVLWVVGGGITVDWGGSEMHIPGYLVIAVVVYCAIITTSMMFIARSFIPVAEAKNQSEAEFRYALTRLRENGESIAILGGEEEERAGLAKLLSAVITAWARMAGQYMRTMAVSHGNFVIASVIPVILCAPKYLAGTMTLGEVMQAAAAFIQVQYAFNWIVDNYPKIAEWTASARRVSSLMVSLDHLDNLEQDGTISAINRIEAEGPAITLRNLSVALSTGKVVIDDADVKVDLGERVLLAGESGSGKSTLVRAIAGLWPWGEGEIITRPGTRLFLMPQKPYLPLGPLRRAATYPMAADKVDDETLRKALSDVGLEHLADRLDEEDTRWSDILSGGEQQRLGFVRLLLHKPDIVIMDESTSALDPEGQAKLFERLGERLPKTAVISVGHRLELEAFHDRKLNLIRHESGAQLVPGDALGPPISLVTLLMKRWRGPFGRKRAVSSPVNPG